MITQSY